MKERKLLIIIIVLAIVIILGIGGMVAAFMFTDILKTDKQLFLKYIAKNEELIEQFDDKDLENYIKKQDSNAYSNEGKITFNISGESTDQALNMLKNANITFKGGTDNTNSYKYQNIDVNYSDTEKISAEYIQMQDHYGLKINDVTNKFIAVQNNNLKEWATKMGLSQEMVQYIPDKLDFNINSLENLFSDAEIEQIKNKYMKIIEPELTDEMFLKNKENDSTIYMLTLTDAKLKTVSSKILTTLKDDELIISKIKQVMLSNQTITEQSVNEYIEQFKQELQKEIDDLNDVNGTTNIKENVNVKVYVKKGNLEKTEVSISNKTNKLTIKNIKNGIQVEIIGEDSNESKVFAMEKIKNSEGLTYNIVTSEAGKQVASVSMKYSGLNTEQVQEKVEVNCDMSNVLTSVHPTIAEPQNQGTISNSSTTNNSLDSSPDNSAINLANENITLMYENSKKFDNNLQKQNITTSDMIVLNTAPNIESISNLLTKVWERFLQVNTEHLTKAMSGNLQNNKAETWNNTSTEGADETNTNANTTNDTNTSNTMNNIDTNSSSNTMTNSTDNNTNTNVENNNDINFIDNTNIQNNNTNTDANGITSMENNMAANTNTNNYGENVTHQTTN